MKATTGRILFVLTLVMAMVATMAPPVVGEFFPFIWIPNSTEGTISKLDVMTGKELGRYRTGPEDMALGLSPSRTTVDLRGNAWVGNRAFGLQGSVVKVGLLEANQCVDRNGNGVIETSKDLNGNGRIDPAELLPWPPGALIGTDECILLRVNVGGVNDIPRAIAIDKNNGVWIGLYNGRRYLRLDNFTGAILKSVDVSPFHPYGAVVDPEGFLWSATLYDNHLLKINPDTGNVQAIPLPHPSYGIGLDFLGNIWVAGWGPGLISKVRRSDGVKLATCSVPGGSRSRGVVVTLDNDVWVANSGTDTVGRMKNDCTPVATIPVGDTPTGVAVDVNGKVWTTNLDSNDASRIDPATNAVDGTFAVGLSPYSYSDMTGFVISSVTFFNRPPIADAGPNRSCAEGTVVCLSSVNSFDPDGDPLSYEWDFGDGSPKATGQFVCHRFPDNGVYTVTLTVRDGRGGVATDTATVTTSNIAPLVNAGPDVSVGVGRSVSFSGSFIDPGRADTHTIKWDFGDGASASGTLTPTHTYSAPGVYTVTLTVTDDDGGVGHDTLRVIVHSPGTALNHPPLLSLEAVKQTMPARRIAVFIAEGSGIKSIALEIFNLGGRKVFSSGELSGNSFTWVLQSDSGQILANGVYLYIVTVRGFNGEIIRSPVKKLVILR